MACSFMSGRGGVVVVVVGGGGARTNFIRDCSPSMLHFQDDAHTIKGTAKELLESL
jgi:hypothetical protein